MLNTTTKYINTYPHIATKKTRKWHPCGELTMAAKYKGEFGL